MSTRRFSGKFPVRLRCGCLATFRGVAPGLGDPVYCPRHQAEEKVEFHYFAKGMGQAADDCAAVRPGLVALRCTLKSGHETDHFDEHLGEKFTERSRVRSGAWGNCGKA